MLFKRKFVITEKMKLTLQSFESMDWFSQCGIAYDQSSYYPYIQETDPARVERVLQHTTNYSGTVCLLNLFKEADHRADKYIKREAGWRFYQDVFIRCDEKIYRLCEKNAFSNLDIIEKGFLIKNGFHPSIKLHLERVLKGLLLEEYFVNEFPHFPLFFNQIIDVYKNGHMAIGWKGKFASNEVSLMDAICTAILPTDGKLIIW